jgi:hypothetical protein
MANDFSESDILGQVIFLTIDIRESDFRGSEAFHQMLLGELKLGQVIISNLICLLSLL